MHRKDAQAVLHFVLEQKKNLIIIRYITLYFKHTHTHTIFLLYIFSMFCVFGDKISEAYSA